MTTTTKRKAEANLAKQAKRAKKAIAAPEAKSRFRKGLFDDSVLQAYTAEYATSAPYKHAVIHDLVNDALLRSVRDEIRDNVSFTPKETDIYKIHQSGDLANLDGLDDAALAKLPSLLSLRDALYSEAFRNYVSHITGCGALSGRKTDMAINVYTPGCYLLCHDDVIGSRKVSYILYLTDPDIPWQAEWGGALRLFPVLEQKGKPADDTSKNGKKGKNTKDVFAKTPGPDPVKIIPPAWNQLSFFAVQPGESFHDVEEVYHAPSPEELKKNGGRVRMAISGWFHIPQPGEAGFVQGAEEAQLENSGLMQLQGNPDQHDRPLPKKVEVKRNAKADEKDDNDDDDDDDNEFSQEDLEFLLKYITPSYLTPDTLAEMAEHFDDESSITLPNILKASFAEKVKADIEQREAAQKSSKKDKESEAGWHVATPPHKHRFLYLQEGDAPASSPWRELLDVLLPSKPFRKWVEMATSTTITAHDLVARRFRRGKDYTLATGHDGAARLELNIGLTPTEGWGDDEEEDEEDEEDEEEEEEEPKGKGKGKGKAATNGKGKDEKTEKTEKNKKNGKKEAVKETEEAKDEEPEDKEVGGLEVYMAGDEEGDDDAAIYKSASDDDNILFFQAAAWNKMTIVLRDSGTLRFVKYINRKAPGDRWDVSATFDIEEDEDEDDDEEEDDNENGVESSEEEFNGFSSSEDSDSD